MIMIVETVYTIIYYYITVMASREDNLLNKLKSCIGSLPSQPPPVPVTAYQSTHVRSQLNSSLSYQKR